MNMNLFDRLVAKLEAPLVLASWMFAFLYMLDRSRYKLFLRPEFGFLVAVGFFALLAMLLAFTLENSRDKHEHGHGPSSFSRILRFLAMTVPLWLMLSASGSHLDADAYRRRAIEPVAKASQPEDPVLVAATPADALATATDKTDSMPLGPSFLEMVVDPRAFAGKRVSAEGMVCHDPEVTRLFGADVFLVFRFAITCCAADARPVAILVKPAKPIVFKESSWIHIEGILSARKMDEKSIVPMINDANCESVKAPEEPYVYP